MPGSEVHAVDDPQIWLRFYNSFQTQNPLFVHVANRARMIPYFTTEIFSRIASRWVDHANNLLPVPGVSIGSAIFLMGLSPAS